MRNHRFPYETSPAEMPWTPGRRLGVLAVWTKATHSRGAPALSSRKSWSRVAFPGKGALRAMSGGGRLVPTVSDPHCFISFTQFLGPCVYDLLIGEGSFRVAQNNNGIAGSGDIGPVALVLVHRQLEAPHFCSSVAQLLKSHYKR